MRALTLLLVLAGCVDERAPIKPADLLRAHTADLATPPPDLTSPGPDLSSPRDLATKQPLGYGAPAGGFLRGGQAAHPTVKLGKSTVRGRLPGEVIDRIVKRHMYELLFCFEKETLKNPNLAGSLTVEAVIANGGTIATATTKNSTVGSSEVEQCVVGAVKRWSFPEPSGIAIVSLPMTFVNPNLPDSTPLPKVTIGKLTVRGPLSAEVAERVVQSHVEELRACFAKEVSPPKQGGKTTMLVVIADDGHVIVATVEPADIRSPLVSSCINAAARQWVFPAPDGGVVVQLSIPMSFKP
jgi:hypothetical protein